MSVEDLLLAARARIDRVHAEALAAERASGALVVDTRPLEQRLRDGELPGAMVIERNVLEWRLDPASEWRIPETGYDRRVIVVCSEGYSSSLVAAGLVDLGLHRAADLVGGYLAWAAWTGSSGPGATATGGGPADATGRAPGGHAGAPG